MRKILLLMLLVLTAGNVAVKADNRGDVRERNRLALAERFTASKLENMLFSTTVDPHWFKSGEKFWYNYKTSEGTRWYIVDPVARKRTEMFDHDKLAAELTEIVKDPFIAAQLPITNLEVDEDGYLTLTDLGHSVAKKVYDRHNIITDFLLSIGVPEEIASTDACKIEHHISDASFEAIKSFMKR